MQVLDPAEKSRGLVGCNALTSQWVNQVRTGLAISAVINDDVAGRGPDNLFGLRVMGNYPASQLGNTDLAGTWNDRGGSIERRCQSQHSTRN